MTPLQDDQAHPKTKIGTEGVRRIGSGRRGPQRGGICNKNRHLQSGAIESRRMRRMSRIWCYSRRMRKM